MMKFSLSVEDGYLVDKSEYHPLLISMLRLDPRLDNVIREFNLYLTEFHGYGRGLYTKYSERPIAYFPLKVLLKDGTSIEVDDIYVLEDVIVNYKDVEMVGPLKFEQYFKIRNNLTDIVSFPYFLDTFCRHLELEYNSSLPNGEFCYRSPFDKKQNVYLVNPNLKGYEHLYNYLEAQEGLDRRFVKEAIEVFEDYLTKINDIALDPFKTIKVINNINTIMIKFEPSIMDKWGLLNKYLKTKSNKGKQWLQ